MTKSEEIVAAVEALPEAQRLEIIDKLLDLLYAENTEIDEEWARVIVQRGREIDRGEVELIPAEQVLEEARNRLKSKCG